MPRFTVETPQGAYDAVIERGLLTKSGEFVPSTSGAVFVVTTADVWNLHGEQLLAGFRKRPEVLFFAGGEHRKRLAEVESLAERMVQLGGDRTSVVVAFGGGIVTDMGGFLASAFMRGIPVVQVPTTLLAQVDAAIGGKTGVNLGPGKNLFGAFHQPLAVLIDPDVLGTLPEREYRAGLYEIIKAGVIADTDLFDLFERHRDAILRRDPTVVEAMISAAVRMKAEVVSADEKEGDLRRILNFGHTVGHALEAETAYSRLLHGEAVAFGMAAATWLAVEAAGLSEAEAQRIVAVIESYGPIPELDGIDSDRLIRRLASDKKTVQGRVHFVLPERIGQVKIVSGIGEDAIRRAIGRTLASSDHAVTR